jgi:predicted restriction endonuclease
MLFDMGVVTVNDDLSLMGAVGRLTVRPGHELNGEHLRYHRDHYATLACGRSHATSSEQKSLSKPARKVEAPRQL